MLGAWLRRVGLEPEFVGPGTAVGRDGDLAAEAGEVDGHSVLIGGVDGDGVGQATMARSEFGQGNSTR